MQDEAGPQDRGGAFSGGADAGAGTLTSFCPRDSRAGAVALALHPAWAGLRELDRLLSAGAGDAVLRTRRANRTSSAMAA
ncbi:hypothetical protein Misp03_32520 [Microbispora sp. NBRC 16548]|nr:hypothetical protein Misp03_32520 [Microbispora sp. NBRC 16548]